MELRQQNLTMATKHWEIQHEFASDMASYAINKPAGAEDAHQGGKICCDG
jgi:hypothetical protein